jgi:hypothetical protein
VDDPAISTVLLRKKENFTLATAVGQLFVRGFLIVLARNRPAVSAVRTPKTKYQPNSQNQTGKHVMRQYLTPPRTLLAAMSVMVVAVGLTTTEVIAGSPGDSGDRLSASKSAHVAALHRRNVALRVLHPGPLASSPYGEFTPFASSDPNFVYVPKVGILNEACNLPTSACPNTERDVQ